MKTPKISVLMPAYNVENYISESVLSILNQSFKDFELIIVDDCSTDKTWNILQELAKTDERIKIFRNNNNLYIAGTRNVLLSKAQSPYIAWQDADDISYPKRLEIQYEFLKKHHKVGIVGGFLEFFKDSKASSIRKYAPDDKTLRKNIFKFSPVAQPAAMIRKECFEKVGEYNLKYPPAEDIDMSFRIGNCYEFANIQQPVIKYRQYESSATYQQLRKIELSTIEIRMNNFNNKNYNATLIDRVYNLLHLMSVYIVPSKIKIWLFNLFRNSR